MARVEDTTSAPSEPVAKPSTGAEAEAAPGAALALLYRAARACNEGCRG